MSIRETAAARALINRFQGGFPIAGRPFRSVAASLGMQETVVIQTLSALLEQGVLSRFGPLYDASRMGGAVTLAALSVPAADFERVAGLVNALPEVAHNYRREHRLNMWFVVAGGSPAEVRDCLDEIGERTGLPVYDFPKLREFYVGLWLALDEQGGVTTVPVPPGSPLDTGPCQLTELDHRVVRATQAGLPLLVEPYQEIAERLSVAADDVMLSLRRMLQGGVIRRIGAVPNHYRLGLRGNGMTVWDIPDESALALGEQVGALDFVSHAYLRPRHPGIWPYNLFAMVHGRDRGEVLDKAKRLEELLGAHLRAHEVLFSTEVLKKTGLRLAA